jgi:hypothetical protein
MKFLWIPMVHTPTTSNKGTTTNTDKHCRGGPRVLSLGLVRLRTRIILCERYYLRSKQCLGLGWWSGKTWENVGCVIGRRPFTKTDHASAQNRGRPKTNHKSIFLLTKPHLFKRGARLAFRPEGYRTQPWMYPDSDKELLRFRPVQLGSSRLLNSA